MHMSRSGRRQRMEPEARRAQLLACAVKVFAERGIGRATHADVAREAGVSVPTTFVYFPTRDDLVRAVLREVERFLMTLIAAAAKPGMSAPDALLAIAWAFAQSVEDTPDYARVWLDWGTAIRGELWPMYLEVQDRIIGEVKAIIHRGQAEGSVAQDLDADDAARIVVGEAHMIALMMFADLERARVRRFLVHLVESALLMRAGDTAPAAQSPAVSGGQAFLP